MEGNRIVEIGEGASGSVVNLGDHNTINIIGSPDSVNETEDGLIKQFARITNLESRELLIPGIAKPLLRTEVRDIEEQLEKGYPVIVTGKPGTGKSGIAYALCTPRSNPELPVLFMDARKQSNITSLASLAQEVNLVEAVGKCLERVGKRFGCRLIIDQLDTAGVEKAGNVFTKLAEMSAQMPGVQVVVLSRRSEGCEKRLLDDLIRAEFVELPCSDLSDEQTRDALRQVEINNPSDQLLSISKNILNLSLVAGIKKTDVSYDFTSILDEVALWDAYINTLRVSEGRHVAQGIVFGDEIVDEATRIACEGIRAEDRTVTINPLETVHRRLVSWGILILYYGYQYRFFHEKLQDFLYARDCVARGCMPKQVVAEIGTYRTRSVLPLIVKLHIHEKSPNRAIFIRESLKNVEYT